MLLLFAACNERDTDKQPLQKREVHYAVAVLPTPVLNIPDFSSVFGGKDGKTLKLSSKNLAEEVEFIALPGTVFTLEKVIKKKSHEILKVKTGDYPYQKREYYIDSRFVEKRKEKPPERRRTLPLREKIIENLVASKGALYIWGGNYIKGIPQMLEFYKPSGNLPEDIKDRWILKGVDCSGLLYEATDGFTPRNVSSLFNYGKPVAIEGLNTGEIAEKLRPLDVIVYKRHMLIVLDSSDLIESSIAGGVRIRDLNDALRILSIEMKPADGHDGRDDVFVIRRWYPE